MKVKAMLSNRHVHLRQETVDILFGAAGITFSHYLAEDGGPYACNEYVDLEGPKGRLTRVRVLGPVRAYDQAELLKTDCYKLGVDAPVRASGSLEGAARLKAVGPCGEAVFDGGILAHRHIHVGPELIGEETGLQYGRAVRVRAGGVRALVFENVLLVSGGEGLVLHVDTEEGNAAGISNGEMLEILED